MSSVRAWFEKSQPVEPPTKEEVGADPHLARRNMELLETIQQLEAERNKALNAVQDLSAQLDAKNAELEAMAAAAAANQPEPVAQDPASSERETVDAIVSRFTSIPGIIATVKGAQTAAPVVWLSGDVEAQADAIKQQGGKWSAKRSAYYFRVA